ncbi:HAD hydrolase-like protein [Lacticaseibacillus porcinae]|uniref:HAD hydrolase-like protein n=1 Tax=Lacticaseibacillus porcinae TaxID=1123687 RepID=UPI000F7B26E9|nr:HAD hydrolase-like protein [Lacticaseibacillus porcinae]
MKQLFFDFDGTIADSHRGIIHGIEYMLQQMHLPSLTDAQYRTFIGPSLTSSLKRYFPKLTDADCAQAVKYYQELYADSAIFELDLYPGIQQVLSDLQNAGYRLNVATAKPEVMVDRIIEHFDLGQYFTGVYGATLDESIRSTKTAVLAYGLEKAQANTAESLMIGDRDTDMQGGFNNHVQTLGVTYGFGSAEELTNAHAAAIVETPQAIPAGIAKLMA